MLPRLTPIPPGREALVDAVVTRLRRGESALLTGPPGVGKTTIARAIAARVDARWLDGAAGLGYLSEAAAERGAPVVIDGLDGVDDDTLAAFLDGVERACLVTRRAHGEPGGLSPQPVAPLALSGEGPGTATHLFDRTLARLTAGMPIETPDDETRRLLLAATDGLPAVIEAIADGWWLHGSALAERLRPLLGGEPARDAPALDGLPVGALDLGALDPDEADAVAALSAAPGAFDLSGAGALLGGDARSMLRRLVKQGMLRVEAPGRFRLYGVVRARSLVDPIRDAVRTAADRRYAEWIVETGDGFADAGRLPESAHPAVDLPTVFAVMEHAWAIEDTDLADRASTLLMYWWDDPVPPWDPVAHAASRAGHTARARFFRAIDAQRGGGWERALTEMQGALAVTANPWVRVVALNWLGSHLAFQPSMRAQRAARSFYEEATAVCRSLGVRWKEAHCLSCRAGLLQAGGDLHQALELYGPVLEIQAERPTWCHWAYNLVDRSRLFAELGRIDEARADSDRAIEAHRANGYPAYEAIAHAERGLVEHLAGDLSAAEYHLERAMTRIAAGPVERESVARMTARMAAVRADQGRKAAAERLMSEAYRVLADPLMSGRLPTLGWERALTAAVLPLYAAFVDPAAAPEAVAEACNTTNDDDRLPLVQRLDEARILVTILRKKGAGGLRVSPGGAAFRIDEGAAVSLARFRAARAILAALAACRVDAPGEGKTTEELFEAGWAGQQIDPISARNRVYAELSRLRKLGLDGWIERADDGYRLVPGRPVSVEDFG